VSVALMVVALGASPLCEQRRGISVNSVHSGCKLVAIVEVPVRDNASANGMVWVKGQQTGSLRLGEVVTVTGEQFV